MAGAVGSDDEAAEEERSYRAHASCAYVRAFEAEPEEDDFDRQAAGGSSSRTSSLSITSACSTSTVATPTFSMLLNGVERSLTQNGRPCRSAVQRSAVRRACALTHMQQCDARQGGMAV